MRVLVLSTVFPNNRNPTYGVFVRERVRHIAQRCEVQVVAPVPWFPGQRWFRPALLGVSRAERQLDIPVHHPRFVSVPALAKSLDGLSYFASLLPFARQLRRRFSFDVIDAHFGYPDGFAAVLLGAALRCPVAITLRGYEVNLATSALRRPQLRFALRHARVTAVSEFLRRLAGDLGVPQDSVRVIPNAVDACQFRRLDSRVARTSLGLAQDRPVLLSVGAFIADKGHERVLDLLPRVIERYPDLLYVAIGNPGRRDSRLDAIQQLVRVRGLEQNVRIETSRPHAEIPLWMSAADVFCMATRREGWSNAITEALACGLPVVTTRVGGNPELVRDAENGFLVPYFESDQFAHALVRAFEHSWDRARIAQDIARYSWNDVADAVMGNLTGLVRAGP